MIVSGFKKVIDQNEDIFLRVYYKLTCHFSKKKYEK